MRNRYSNMLTIVIAIIVFGGFGLMLFSNAQPTSLMRVVIPTQAPPTQNPNALAEIFSAGFGDNSTPLPTIAIPTQQFTPPTIAPAEGSTGGTVRPAELNNAALSTVEAFNPGATPTPIPATPTIPAGGDENEPLAVQIAVPRATQEWQPPSLPVPQSRDPLGRDHYIFARPVDSNANGYGLFYYPYGASGVQLLAVSRIHHGIDFSNPVGTPIRAAGSGTVIFASTESEPYYPGSPSYGQVVIIEHDFGWDNQLLWTLYAHLERPLVAEGDYVQMGDVIGLSGNSGRSSGPHLHFEVRMGEGPTLTYGQTFNPVLWIAPYVGHGTVAGRLVDQRGEFVDDVTVVARNLSNGRVFTTSTYTFSGTVNQVNSDPKWLENFALGDLPQGRYVISSDYNGQRVSEIVDIYEGMTTFVELEPVIAATAQPVTGP
ncbi:MAG: M23 family metallopeptidase [Chloroflexota bacterium]